MRNCYFKALRPDEYKEAEGESTLESGQSDTTAQEQSYIKSKETILEIKRNRKLLI